MTAVLPPRLTPEELTAIAALYQRDVTVENGVCVVLGQYGRVYLQPSDVRFKLRMAEEKRTCKACAEYSASGFGPRHEGSTGCKSGSLASGGNVAHCTCDTCF